jgi:hypothetical protein
MSQADGQCSQMGASLWADDVLNGGARLIGRLATGWVAIIPASLGSATLLFDQGAGLAPSFRK